MKRLNFLIIILSCAGFCLAQDIIALKNGERIEDIFVSSITNESIVYKEGEKELTIPRNSVDAILYADGRYEQIKPTLVGDSVAKAKVAELGYDAQELQAMIENGEDRKALLWLDKSYSKECRKAGKKVYYKVFNELYQPALKEAKRSGLSQMEALQKAMDEVFPKAMKESNETVRECNGGMKSAIIEPAVEVSETKSVETEPATASVEDTKNIKRVIPQACSIEGKNAYDRTFDKVVNKALQQGYAKSQAKIIASEFATIAKEKAIDECYNYIVLLDNESESFSLSDTLLLHGPISLLLSEESKKIVPQACNTEGKKAFDAAYSEAFAKAIRQGYSKSQASTIANEAAKKARQMAIDEYYNRIVIQGEYYFEEMQQEEHPNGKNKQNKKTTDNRNQGGNTSALDLSDRMITKVNKNEYRLGSTVMDKKAYENFIYQNCPAAWKKHRQAKQTIAAGWTFFSVGIAMTSMWGLLGVKDESYHNDIGYRYYRTSEEVETTAIIMGSCGAALTFFSTTLLGGGYGVLYNTYKTYNKKCVLSQYTRSTPITLDIISNQNGIGLALKF